ncbi:MAG: HPr family phosphocarrier protein [Alistipes sp.]|jgi:phosphotransferase system HPr (HPr) family protein|nr:HPr family phosphocarrier protein [Alistipes sp.]
MMNKTIVLTAPNGMHARPAGELVKLAKSLDGKVTLATEVKSVSATSMLGILSLGLKSGAEITVTAEGGNEEANLTAVVDFIAAITE